MSIRAAAGIGEFLYNKAYDFVQGKIAERVGPFIPKEGEYFYHGTQQPPILGDNGAFETNCNFFVVPKEAKSVAEKFASGDGFSWKRQAIPGEENSPAEGKLLKVRSPVYMKTFFGGIHYVPPGHQVSVVKEKTVEKEAETPLDKARKIAQASQFDQ